MSLESRIKGVIKAAPAEIGVAVHHVESGEEVQIDGDRPFPMASVFKIPVLVEAFRQIHAGHFALEDRWTYEREHRNRGSGILPFLEAGFDLSVRDFLTLMIIISDNTATDIVLERVGGPGAVERAMRYLGLDEVWFKLTVRELLDDCMPGGVDDDPAERQRRFDAEGYRRDSVAFNTGPDNNVSTPADMTRLVAMIYRGDVVNREACDQMLGILSRQQINERLPRFLPRGTRFAHKTGTLAGIRNDSGVIWAGEESHVALTVFTRWNDEEVWGDAPATQQRIFAVETAMGQIGRAVYEGFAA